MLCLVTTKSILLQINIVKLIQNPQRGKGMKFFLHIMYIVKS